MDFLDIMRTYFRGERIEALAFIVPTALALIALAVVAFKAERPGFAWGLAVPLVAFGLLGLTVGATVGLRTAGQLEALERAYETDPAAMAAEELPRMEGVNRWWPIYLGAWTLFVVSGLILRFAIHADWSQGLAIGLMLVGAVGFAIDGFAERRARPYTAALEAIAPDPSTPSP